MVTHDDDTNKRCEEGEKRCFDLFATLLLAFGDDEIRASRSQEVQERNMFMIRTITTAATNTFSLGKRKKDDDHESRNQDNTASSSRSLVESNNQQNTASSSSLSLVEYKRRRVVSDDEPIRAQPIREIKPPVKKRKGPVKQKEPVRREPGVTPGWLVEMMREKNGVDAKLVIEKVITTTDLKPDPSSLSLVEYKRRRVVSDDEPIRAQPIREIKPPVKKRKGPVKQKEPVRREAVVTPGWLVEMMRRNKGVDAKLVIEKVITTTDLKPDQGRFLIPFKQISEMDFLNETELKILEKGKKGDGKKGDGEKGDGKKGVDVILLNSNNVKKQWNANLRIWEMSNNFNYALCSGWNLFVGQNDLRVNQTRRLWSFHSHDGTLFLAFDPLPVAQAMSLALVPFNPEASSSSSSMAEDPYVCEEINRRLEPKIPRRSRTPRVWIQDQTSDSSNLHEGLDLNRTPPPGDTEMDSDLEAVQETHIRRSTSQEAITETSVVSFTEATTVDLQLWL